MKYRRKNVEVFEVTKAKDIDLYFVMGIDEVPIMYDKELLNAEFEPDEGLKPVIKDQGILIEYCPTCSAALRVEVEDGVLYRRKRRPKYCDNCGQHIDWT